MLSYRELPDSSFGTLIELGANADPTEDSVEFRQLFARHGLVVIRGREFGPGQQAALMACLGRVEPDADGNPMQMHVSNTRPDTSAPEGELSFHFDYAYDPEPISAISLYGMEVSDGVTPTLFASSARALRTLPDALRARVESLDAAHACFLDKSVSPDERVIPPGPQVRRGEPGWGPQAWRTVHPAVLRTAWDVPSLFLCAQHTDRFLGMPADDSEALLEELFEYLYDGANIYEHRWQPGDLVVWDNIAVQHARPAPSPAPRTLRRFHVSDADLTAEYLAVGRANGFL